MLSNRQYKYGAIFCALWMTLGVPPAAAGISADKSSAVIFSYHHVGEEFAAQGNLSLEQFKAHISELKSTGYNVRPLPAIISALKKGDELPPQTIALTFDGAWLSTLSNAVPLLEEANLPFTVFFASDMADANAPNHMSWRQLKALKKKKLATLGILPSAYAHMVGSSVEQNSARINKAVARYREELDEEPKFFSYPYGEFTSSLRKQVAGYAFEAAFGQQSGVAHAKSDFYSLPRFTLTDAFGDLDRFLLTAHALPLPVSDVLPDDMIVTQNPPMIGFTVTPEITNLSRLSCFASGLGKTELARLGNNRIEIRLAGPMTDRSMRVNCTIPAEENVPGAPPIWRWFGMELIDPALSELAPEDAPETEE